MSKLLEILGRGVAVNTADLIWYWLNSIESYRNNSNSEQYQQLGKIVGLIRNMKQEAARDQLNVYLFGNPSCVLGRMASAAEYLQNNDLDKAIEELTHIYKCQPSNTMALYALGHCYERVGKESRAVEFYQDCLKFKKYLQLPRQRLAAIYLKNNQLEKTLNEYEILKNEYPDDISTLVALGHLYIATAKYTQAIEAFNTAILMHPDNFNADDNNIESLIADGQLQDALEQLTDLLEKEPERTDLILKRADVLSMLGATADALSQYQEAIRICPDFLEATIKIGTQYLQLNDEQSAAQCFNKAVEINDRIVDSYIGLALAQKSAGMHSDALATLSLAAAIQPNSSLLFAETATLQFKAGVAQTTRIHPIDAVIAAHRQQIAHNPQNPDLNYRLGVLLMSVGRINDAIEAFQIALDINLTYGRARSKMVLCLFETGHKNSALDLLVGPECLGEDMLKLHYKVAILFCDSIKFASSLINLEQSMQDNFANADVAVNISIVLQNLGLLDTAEVTWDNLWNTTSHAMDSK